MFTVLESLLIAFYTIEKLCYAWSDLTAEMWETFTEFNAELLNACVDWLYLVEYLLSPLARWVLESI